MRLQFLLLIVALAACDLDTPLSSPATLTYTEDAHAAYREAMESFQAKEWEDARAKLSEVKRLFSFSHYGRLAELRIADVDFEQGKYSDAIAGYRAFIRGHGSDENVEYAKYRICKALYLDISDTVLLPPAEERDQANTVDAHRELIGFRKRFPGSRYGVEADYLLEVVTQRLVRHDLYVARYYLRKDELGAAIARVDHALQNYPGSGLDAEALVLKGETLLKMHKPKEARAVFEQVVRDVGGPFATVARRFLEALPSLGGSPSPPGNEG